jgi:hypothetical protein
MPPEIQFNWGLGWIISVLVNTLKPHSRWMQNACREPVLLISVGNYHIKYNFEVKWQLENKICFFLCSGTHSNKYVSEQHDPQVSWALAAILR